jgi:ABC-type amino acid transport substrate-binding protein
VTRGPAVAAMLVLSACADAPAERTADPSRGAGRPDSAGTWAAAAHAGSATVRVVYVPADGFAYRAPDGTLTGVTVDVMRAFGQWVSATRGVHVDITFEEEPDWRTFYDRVRAASGGVFGLGNVTITDERRAELRFSPAYLTNVAVLLTDERVPELQQLDEIAASFADLVPLGFEGTLHEARVRALRDAYLPDARVALARSNGEILDSVAGGGYFGYIDAYNYWRASEQGMPLRRHAVADDPAEEFGIIMPLDNDWAALLDEFFERDGGYRSMYEYRSILERHLGASLTAALEEARLRAAAAKRRSAS